jgi:hypothetical protein
MFSIVAPASPGDPGVAAEAAMRAIQEMKNKGTGKEFGVEQGMSEYDAVKAFGENINKRTQELVAGGKTQKQSEDIVQAQLAEKNIVAEVREARGLVAGFGRLGVKLGGFKMSEEIERETPEDFEQKRVERYRSNDEGLHEAARIETEVRRLEQGRKDQNVELELKRAKARVTESGELREFGASTVARKTFGAVTKVDLEQQIVNREALASVERRATEAGIANPYDGRSAYGKANVATESALRSQLEVINAITELLQKIEKNTGEKRPGLPGNPAVPHGGAGKPISAPPPPSVRNAGS